MSRNRKTVLWIIIGTWLVGMVALSPLLIQGPREARSALRVFRQYSDSLVARQYSQAYKQCGPSFRQAVPYDQFVALHESLRKRHGPLRSVKRSSYEVHGNGSPMQWTATINADFVYQDASLTFELVFRKEGGRWALFGAKEL